MPRWCVSSLRHPIVIGFRLSIDSIQGRYAGGMNDEWSKRSSLCSLFAEVTIKAVMKLDNITSLGFRS